VPKDKIQPSADSIGPCEKTVMEPRVSETFPPVRDALGRANDVDPKQKLVSK
ncbi:hypothetical protein KI387_037937, partial [Taxus chinensis]